MNKEQAIAMIPRQLKGTTRYIEAIDREGNKLMFPRRKSAEQGLQHVMESVIRSSPEIKGFEGGFALWMETIFWNEEKKQQQNKWDWIYFVEGPVLPDKEDEDRREQAAEKNSRIISKRFRELEQRRSPGEGEAAKLEVQPSDNNDGGQDVELPEVASQLQIQNNCLSADLVDEFLKQYNINSEKLNNFKKNLLYLVEFSIQDPDWDREEAVRGYYNFLVGKGFDKEQIKIICSPVSRFYDWLYERKIIRYNPIKTLKWKRDEQESAKK